MDPSPHFLDENDTDELIQASAERLFEAVMEQSPDRIYIKDRQSRFIAINRSLAEAFGLKSRSEARGKTDFDFFTDEHAREAYKDEQEILRTGQAMISKEEKETWIDGKITWASSTKAPLLLASGKILGLVGISRDITDQRRAQIALQKSEQQLREQNAVMEADFESARNVQSIMIPGDIPVHDRLITAVRLFPMAAVGGDIISFPPDPEGRLLFFLGDVVGHGVQAAIFTVLLKHLTDKLGEKYMGDPRLFLNELNVDLFGRIPSGFVTGLCGHFEETDGRMELKVSNAGHPEVFHYAARSGELSCLKLHGGAVLGLPIHAGAMINTIPLEVGDRVYAFSDGVQEARTPRGDEFGTESILASSSSWLKSSLRQSLTDLYSEVRTHTAGRCQQDDISMLAFEVR